MEDNKYISTKELAKHLHIEKGDRIYVTSDVKELLYEMMQHEDDTDLNILIDGIIDIIGPDGTLVFPTFNWAFCKGETFDIRKTPCKTGSLGKIALKRDDFLRTGHPIYSFAVWGRGQKELCEMTNKSSFGNDSPFAYMVDNGFKNLFIDKDLEHSFVFVHYCEQSTGHISYRYLKDFTADYIDYDGSISKRTYDMNVRDLDLDVTNVIYAFEDEFVEKGIMTRWQINGLEMKMIDLKAAYPIICEDVRHNRSRRVCSYIGQDNAYIEEGRQMFDMCREMFPICRSITGNGVRATFDIIKKKIPDLELHEVPTGTQVFDWTVPKEWNIKAAYIENEKGEKIIDFDKTNLHVLGYSTPIDEWMSLDELMPHIYTLKDQPDLIPYSTSYYKERWGFAMSENDRLKMQDGRYHAFIDSTLTDGSLTYGELIIPGESDEEVFFSSYICHPSMANNECSGPAVLTFLADYVKHLTNRRYTYRFVLLPETIGAITYLSRNLDELKEKVICGFNVTCVGDDRTYSVVHSRYADTLADRVIMKALSDMGVKFDEYSYLKRGSDERQYQAPGVDLPLMCFCRSKYHVYPEYHTSGDNLDIISPDGLAGSFDVLTRCINMLEADGKDAGAVCESLRTEAIADEPKYKVTCLCEPQLGKRGLMPTMSSKKSYQETQILKDMVAYADGTNTIEQLAQYLEQPLDMVKEVADKLSKAGLLEIV